MIFLFWIFVLTVEARDDSDYPSYNLCKIFDEDMFAKMLPDMGLGMCRAGSAEGTTQLRLTQFEIHPCLYYRVP